MAAAAARAPPRGAVGSSEGFHTCALAVDALTVPTARVQAPRLATRDARPAALAAAFVGEAEAVT